ncbi:D-alanyl-D-alanine carboxypeptidase [Streptomyces thermolineatus]|uniref:D-alanyl-D-alanine carboxypeptidase n=1 Tax=Streptomyces thermolineatus TaxID=44033 RepID=UPI00384DC1B3
MAGKSPGRADQQKSSGETAEEPKDPRLEAFREPDEGEQTTGTATLHLRASAPDGAAPADTVPAQASSADDEADRGTGRGADDEPSGVDARSGKPAPGDADPSDAADGERPADVPDEPEPDTAGSDAAESDAAPTAGADAPATAPAGARKDSEGHGKPAAETDAEAETEADETGADDESEPEAAAEAKGDSGTADAAPAPLSVHQEAADGPEKALKGEDAPEAGEGAERASEGDGGSSEGRSTADADDAEEKPVPAAPATMQLRVPPREEPAPESARDASASDTERAADPETDADDPAPAAAPAATGPDEVEAEKAAVETDDADTSTASPPGSADKSNKADNSGKAKEGTADESSAKAAATSTEKSSVAEKEKSGSKADKADEPSGGPEAKDAPAKGESDPVSDRSGPGRTKPAPTWAKAAAAPAGTKAGPGTESKTGTKGGTEAKGDPESKAGTEAKGGAGAAPAIVHPAPRVSEPPPVERTRQQPLPPVPGAPLQLLAELTNTPPPPETPLRTFVRRVKIWTPLVLLLVLLVGVAQMLRPLPQPALTLTAADSYTFEGGKPSIPWPDSGQAALDVEGLGTFGSSGEQKPVPIASVAKTMTAYVILKDRPIKPGSKGATLTMDKQAADDSGLSSEGESTINVTEGQKISQYEALEDLMIASANNIARYLARWDAGSEEAFVKKMNEAAAEIGMEDTTYTDPSGLKSTTVSTAVDQVKLAKKVMDFPVFREIVDKGSYTPSGYNSVQYNWNTLINDPGVNGIKTGSSTAAGGNLLFSAKQPVDGTEQLIVGAVLGQYDTPILGSAINASRELIKTGQEVLTSAAILKKGDVVGYVDDGLGGRTPVVVTKNVSAVGWPGLEVKIAAEESEKGVPGTAKAGTKVGTLTVGDGPGQVKVPVALETALEEPSIGARLTRIL